MTPIRVTDLAVTADFTRLVTIGMDRNPAPVEPPRPANGNQAAAPGAEPVPTTTTTATAGNQGSSNGVVKSNNKMIIYDLATKQPEL